MGAGVPAVYIKAIRSALMRLLAFHIKYIYNKQNSDTAYKREEEKAFHI